MGEWRADGFGTDDVEVWAIGSSDDVSAIEGFADGSTSSCFVGGSTVYSAYEASKDDVVIIDREGNIRHRFDSGADSLRDADQRAKVDGWVRALLD